MEYYVDSEPFIVYASSFSLAGGIRTVYYRSRDRAGNLEAARYAIYQVDGAAPASHWLASGDRIEKGGKFYLNALGRIALESADPVVSNVASGLEGIYYGIDAAAMNKYTAAFGLAEGIRTVNFSAKDNVGNTEVAKSTVIYVDGTKPLTGLSLSGDQYPGDKQYISQRTDIVITAADPVVNEVSIGVKETRYAVDGGAFSDYSRFKLGTEGRRVVSFYSSDYVNNVESVKTAELWVDMTAPVTELSISGARYSAPGEEKLYITRDSGIILTSADPLSNNTASGLMLTKYRLDGGNWQVYLGSVSIAAEGLHTVEYYSLDRVQNAEAPRSALIAVDNTPPVAAISLGVPIYEVFGLKIITPETPVTLAAVDPASAGPASGVRSIYYELTDAVGWSSGIRNYTGPFSTGRQGTYTIRYWSADNAGNTGAPLEAKLRVSSLRNDALEAVEGLEMAGSGDIAGTVRSNTAVSLAGNSRILGDVYASTISLSGKAQITGQQHSGAATLTPVPLELADIVYIASSANNNSLIPAKYIVDGRLVVPAKDAITLSTGIYYFNGIELGGGAKVSVNGKADILVAGDISIKGGASLNAAGSSSFLNIFISTGAELTFTGGGSLAAYVYAPYSQLKLAGNALLGGHYFVKSAVLSGAGNIVQAGETLPQAATATSDASGKKKASALAAGGAYNVLAGPDPAFRLGEIYVFPNPAKGGEAPIFHIETGIADSVNIKIYTVSGRAAHEHTLTGMPAELDDGNGLSYAYEYAWRGHIPSGVYLYYIEAQKAGEKLKKTGKFAIVR